MALISSLRYTCELSHCQSHTQGWINVVEFRLSEQLYERPTHFLLELIQNADDNSYQSNVIPSLSITFGEHFLRMDCNEIGFMPSNVDAICRVGRSTKSGLKHIGGYVGEKGIGFKSVFKVADVVFIASRHYTFKFEKKTKQGTIAQLGMIAPLWVPPENFPGGIRKGYTSIYMRLSPETDKHNLAKEIHSLEPTLLMFLNKLRHVDIKFTGSRIWSLEKTLTRKDEKGNHTRITRLFRGSTSSPYIVVKETVPTFTEVIPEATRLGVLKTEIVLAFPLEGIKPCLKPQQVYAFLPIRHYGFQVSLLRC